MFGVSKVVGDDGTCSLTSLCSTHADSVRGLCSSYRTLMKSLVEKERALAGVEASRHHLANQVDDMKMTSKLQQDQIDTLQRRLEGSNREFEERLKASQAKISLLSERLQAKNRELLESRQDKSSTTAGGDCGAAPSSAALSMSASRDHLASDGSPGGSSKDTIVDRMRALQKQQQELLAAFAKHVKLAERVRSQEATTGRHISSLQILVERKQSENVRLDQVVQKSKDDSRRLSEALATVKAEMLQLRGTLDERSDELCRAQTKEQIARIKVAAFERTARNAAGAERQALDLLRKREIGDDRVRSEVQALRKRVAQLDQLDQLGTPRKLAQAGQPGGQPGGQLDQPFVDQAPVRRRESVSSSSTVPSSQPSESSPQVLSLRQQSEHTTVPSARPTEACFNGMDTTACSIKKEGRLVASRVAPSAGASGATQCGDSGTGDSRWTGHAGVDIDGATSGQTHSAIDTSCLASMASEVCTAGERTPTSMSIGGVGVDAESPRELPLARPDASGAVGKVYKLKDEDAPRHGASTADGAPLAAPTSGAPSAPPDGPSATAVAPPAGACRSAAANCARGVAGTEDMVRCADCASPLHHTCAVLLFGAEGEGFICKQCRSKRAALFAHHQSQASASPGVTGHTGSAGHSEVSSAGHSAGHRVRRVVIIDPEH